MPRLGELIPDVEVLLAMEPEQLAGCFMQIMNSEATRERLRTLGHWMHELFEGANPPYPYQHRNEVFRAVAEAWNWLEVQGLVVWQDEANGRNGFRVPSRRGERLVTADDFTQFLRGAALPREFLHPRLAETVWLLFLKGDYDTAVFQAFKEVEVAVRRAAALPNTDYGVTLVR